ncbi:MAG: hypothetical protein ACXVAA_00705 [Candidatus Binataceae bacterium]
MHRLTIPSMTALLVVLFAAATQAQPAPAARPQAQTDHATAAATRAERAKAAMRHRVILLRVDEVLAADTGEGIDMRLLPMGGRLESLFRYTTYRLISRQIGRTECGRTAAFTLPGGWIVHVAPSAVRDDMIAMELMLFNGAHPMMTTDVRMRNHGMLIIGGPHYRQGMLIIPIGADALELATPSGPIAVTPEGTRPEGTSPEMAAPGVAAPDAGTPDMAPFDAGAPDAGAPEDVSPPNAPNP